MADQITLNPDTLLFLNRSRVIGGRHSHSECVRDDLTGERRDTEIKTEVVIENVQERKEAEAIVAYSHGLIRKVSTATLIGALGPKSGLEGLTEEIEALKARAEDFNARATTCRVEIGVLPITIAVALGPEAVRAIAAEAQSRLIEIRDAIREGRIHDAEGALRRGKNLASLGVGPVADGIAFGLDEARERFADLKRRSKPVNGIAETPASVGRTLDLTMLETAISLLTYTPATELSMIAS